jgi:very-short-patch-repair endonuclease
METKVDTPTLWGRLVAIAAGQYGLLTRAQLLAAGVGSRGITRMLSDGRLVRLHRGVYALGRDALRPEAYWLAAVLACGHGAVLSHQSAGALWGLRPSAATSVSVSVGSTNGRAQRRGIGLHRCRRLRDDEVTEHRGIPVTTVARTLLDLADVLSRQSLKRTIDEAEYLRLLDLTSLKAVVDNNPGRRGATLMSLITTPPQLTKSRLERAFLALVERHGLPRPQVNFDIEGYVADFVWPDHKLIVETDGAAAHDRPGAFHRDRLRDRRLLRAGYRTIRLTDELLDDERAVVDDLRHLMMERAGLRPD